jgi:hypothetical protein
MNRIVPAIIELLNCAVVGSPSLEIDTDPLHMHNQIFEFTLHTIGGHSY